MKTMTTAVFYHAHTAIASIFFKLCCENAANSLFYGILCKQNCKYVLIMRKYMGKFDGALLASDMDGTLLNSEHEVSRENIEALEYFTKNGGKFALATGRMIHAINLYAQMLPVNAPIIALNGAVVYDLAKNEVLHSRPHDRDIVEVVEGLAREFPELGVEVVMLDRMYVCRGSEVSRIHCEIIRVPYVLTDVRDAEGVCMKMNLTQEPECLDRAERYLKARYPDVFYIVHSDVFYLEVLHAQANKGYGLKTIAELLGIERKNVYAIGDHFNDVELLNNAGFAFAPANAEPGVKAAANLVVPSNNEHAIMHVIEYIDGVY